MFMVLFYGICPAYGPNPLMTSCWPRITVKSAAVSLLPQSELLASSAGNMFIQLLVVAFLAIFNTVKYNSL